MESSRVQKVITVLKSAFDGLKVPVGDPALEALSVKIYGAMGHESRLFHTVEHIFSFLPSDDPIYVLAAVFHDLVYSNVDHGWPRGLEGELAGFAAEPTPSSAIRTKGLPLAAEALSIFGLQEGDPLPSPGTNEVLSALALVQLVGGVLPRDELLAVVVCIEASIPFRTDDTYPIVGKRLKTLGFSAGAISRQLERAVAFANKDVSDFRMKETSAFLNNTWKLLPELNPALRLREQFSVVEYARSLLGMEAFFRFLSPEKIFHSYGSQPEPEILREWKETSGQNLATAIDYLGAKILAIGFLEAVARTTGGDGPVTLFMGDVDIGSERFEYFLPPSPSPSVELGLVGEILCGGRKGSTRFDTNKSPLAYFLALELYSQGLAKYVSLSKDFMNAKLEPLDYLRAWPAPLMTTLLEACYRFIPTRQAALRALGTSLGLALAA